MELQAAMDYHMAALRARRCAPGTLAGYALVEERFIAFVSRSLVHPPTLAALNAANVRAFLVALPADHTTISTAGAVRRPGEPMIRVSAGILKIWSRFLEAEEYFSSDPLRRLGLPRAPKRMIPSFSRDQVELMISLCADTHYPWRNRSVIMLLAETGLRISELLGLTLGDVELASSKCPGRAKILGKGRKERWVYFGGKTSQSVTKYLTTERPRSSKPWVFVGRDGRQLTRSAVDQVIKYLGRRAGVSEGVRCSAHTFRHTFAREYLKAHPGHLLQVQALLGHSNLDQTRHYAALARLDVEQGYESLMDDWGIRSPRRAAPPASRTETAPVSAADIIGGLRATRARLVS